MIPRGLIVSVQAPVGSPLRDSYVMAALARAARDGGAVAIRAQGVDDIAAIRAAVDLPLIGLIKRDVADSDVYITPGPGDAQAAAGAGADVVAADATLRPRPGGVPFAELVASVQDVPVLADVDSHEAGVAARADGAAAVATTLSGYTAGRGSPVADGGGSRPGPDLGLVRSLAAELDCPVVAEGRYGTPDDVRRAFDAGAHAVVIGTAITDARALTRRFAEAARG